MNAQEIVDILIKLGTSFKDILIGGTGGLVMYFVENKRLKVNGVEAKMNLGSMFINVFIGSFVAYVIGSSIGPDVSYRDGIVALIGMCSYSIVGLLESRFTQWAVDVFMALIGGGKK